MRQADYRNRILKELEYEQTMPRRHGGKPMFYDIMKYCGVPYQQHLMDRFRENLHWLVTHGYVIRVCTERNGLGEDVAGYYTLPAIPTDYFRKALRKRLSEC